MDERTGRCEERAGAVYMRYDTPVYFQKITPGEYDPASGNYAEDSVEEAMRYASVMDAREETMRLVYGQIRQGALIVHLQNHYKDPFDRIRIGDTVYSADYTRRLRVKQAFVVSEVQ